MNILLVGFGFYVLGNENFIGGTIMPAILKWKRLIRPNNFSITCIVKSNTSKLYAKKRFEGYKNKYKNIEGIDIQIKEYDELDKELKFRCAIVAIPERSHLECIKFLVKRTNDIICVKPFSSNSMEVFEAKNLCQETNTNIFIDFHKRFDEANIEFIKNASKHNHNKGLFTFSYGQKVEMPFKYFSKWADSSNPFQYLAPHYLDIISQILRNKDVILEDLKIEGSSNYLTFQEKPNLISTMSCNLKIFNEEFCYLINAICNWAEPKMTPFNSRQRIEFQTNSLHLISEQDNRGQFVIKDDSFKIPNPHFMSQDYNLNSNGYGVSSFFNFFEYLHNRFPKDLLVSIDEYEFIAKVIDHVNLKVKR